MSWWWASGADMLNKRDAHHSRVNRCLLTRVAAHTNTWPGFSDYPMYFPGRKSLRTRRSSSET